MKNNYVRIISIAIIYLSAALFPSQIFPQNSKTAVPAKDTLRYLNNPLYPLQRSMFDLYKTRHADIVMFGNSLTHGAAWNELLGRPNVVERGITSDVLYGFEARINSILKLSPKIVFIMGGLNDIYNWTPVNDIFDVYVRILKALKSKNVITVIQSTTYSAKTWGKDYGGTPEVNSGRNREVDKLNALLSDYAKRNNIDYIDVNALTAGKDGFLRPELAYDGLHFNSDGYRIWAREVEKVLLKYKM